MQQQQLQPATTAAVEPPRRISPYVVRTHSSPPVTGFLARQALILGVVQIVVEVLCIAFNAAAIGINEVLSTISHGIWGGM